MSSSASLTASLRLEIAEYQANLAKATGEAKRFKEQLVTQSQKGGRALDGITDGMKRIQLASKPINPWVTATPAAVDYVRKLDAIAAAHQRLAASGARTAALFAPKPVNPWTTASHGMTATATPLTLAQREQANPFVGRKNEGYDSNRIMAQQAMQQRSMQAQAASYSKRSGGGGRMQIGMIGMQAQDVAVQLQMGTKAAIVLGQQGSQLLGAFGAGGAIAGGVIAIGAAFYTMADHSNEAFQSLMKDAASFEKQMKLVMVSVNSGNIAHGVSGIDEQIKKYDEAGKKLYSMSGQAGTMLARMARMVHLPGFEGAKSSKQQIQAEAEKTRIAREMRADLIDKGLQSSSAEVNILKLRVEGRKEEADVMQEQIRLASVLAGIEATSLPKEVKDQLSNDARSKSASTMELDRKAVTDSQALKDKAEIAALEESIAESARKQLDPADRFLALAKEQDAVFDDMAKKGGLFFDRSVAGLEAWADAQRKSGDGGALLATLKQLEKAKKLQEEMDAANKDTQQQTTKSDQDNDKERDGQKRMKQTRESLALETKIAQEQARAGKDDNKAIAAFRDELNVKQLTSQIQDQLKISEGDALKIAKEKVGAERDAANAIKAQGDVEKMRKQFSSRQALAADTKVGALRAAGKDDEADKLEKRIKLMEEIKRIHEETGLSEQQAAVIAKQRLSDQERAADRAARAAGLTGADGPPRKIKRKDTEDQDPNGRYGLAGRPSAQLANVGGLASNAPLTKNGGTNGFWDLQTGKTGQSGSPSARGQMLYDFGGGQTDRAQPLNQVQQQNAATADKAKGGDDWQSALIARLKTEMAPAIAEAMAAALLQNS